MFEEFQDDFCHIHFEFKSDDLGTFNKFLNIIHKYEYRYSFYTLDTLGRGSESSSQFTIILEDTGDEKIKIIKVVREATGLDLREAKDIVDNPPSTIKENISKSEAEKIKKAFENYGATVSILGSDDRVIYDGESKIMAFDINIPKNFSLIREIRDFCVEYGNIFTNASEVENNQLLRKWMKETM